LHLRGLCVVRIEPGPRAGLLSLTIEPAASTRFPRFRLELHTSPITLSTSFEPPDAYISLLCKIDHSTTMFRSRHQVKLCLGNNCRSSCAAQVVHNITQNVTRVLAVRFIVRTRRRLILIADDCLPFWCAMAMQLYRCVGSEIGDLRVS
jgi:hypothetical protein